MLGRGRQLAVVSILVVAVGVVPRVTQPAYGAGIPASGFATIDFATGFCCGPVGPIGLAFDATGQLFVSEYFDGAIYKFGPDGGAADAHLLGCCLGGRSAGLAFTTDGRLYLAQQGGVVIEVDPSNGRFLRTVASGFNNSTGLAVDPISGDLFVSLAGGGPTVYRLSNFRNGPANVMAFASVDVDGITFAPDGTLYGSGFGTVYRIEGTNSPNAGMVTPIASVPNADGIALVAPAAGSTTITQLAVNRVDGIITLVDFSSTPVKLTNVVTGGSRGDFVAVGPDKCLYATQTSSIEKVTASDGSCPFLPTGVRTPPLTSCQQQGQMVNNFTSPGFFKWSLNYGISVCEGLVLSHVVLERRQMAERMSLPYLDLVTCTSASDVTRCTNTTTRHITLRMDSVEPQADPAAYTRVHLMSGPDNTLSFTFSAPPCNGRPACNYWTISAEYRVDLAPAGASGIASTHLDVIQRYEFYEPFSEKQFKDIACEPSQSTVVALVATPLPDCGRWKPIITYDFEDTTGKTLLRSLNAAERLHFTPDAVAVRAATLMRDCNNAGPSSDLCGPTGLLEMYSGESAISHEVAIRGLVADSTSHSTLAGRYDNVHQTPSSAVQGPVPIPPGCPECVHVHWKWSDKIGAPDFFGRGKPLICDAILAAQATGCSSHQQLDVGLVAYHSEALSPGNFMQLINGGDASPLNLSVVNNQFVGGIAKGTGTLEFPSGGCSSRADLTSWGQCGEVLWLSATSYTTVAHDEDHDNFFAFGGFYCGACIGDYATQVNGLQPTYRENQHITNSRRFAVGSTMSVEFNGLAGDIQVNDVMVPGLRGVSACFVEFNLGVGHVIPGSTCNPCPAPTTDAAGRSVMSCDLPDLGPTIVWNLTITGTVGPIAPGTYSNTVHAIWGSATTNDPVGGNYRNSDSITIN